MSCTAHTVQSANRSRLVAEEREPVRRAVRVDRKRQREREHSGREQIGRRSACAVELQLQNLLHWRRLRTGLRGPGAEQLKHQRALRWPPLGPLVGARRRGRRDTGAERALEHREGRSGCALGAPIRVEPTICGHLPGAPPGPPGLRRLVAR